MATTPRDTVPTWLDRAGYPFMNQYVELAAGRLHYVDEGDGEAILFVHGTPAWPHEEAPEVVVRELRAFLVAA